MNNLYYQVKEQRRCSTWRRTKNWLGHSQIETTQIYARATMEMKRQAVQKLGNNPCSVLENDVAFRYADDAEAMKKLCGLLK